MRASIFLAVLPLMAFADTGSFVKISAHGHGHEYSHGAVVHPAAVPAVPVYHEPAPVYTPKTYSYVPITEAPVYHEPAPTTTPAPYHPEPLYHPAPVHHAPSYVQPYHGYGYEEPQANCSVVDVTEYAEVCIPAFETNCAYVELDTKIIVDKQQCDTITHTVCTEAVKVIPNKICSYKYHEKTEDTVATTVKVTFKKSEHVQYVSQCEPVQHGYGGYGGYGQHCRDVPQTTRYNSPIVTPIDVPIKVTYPEAVKVCVNKPISLPIVTCEDISTEKCITVPAVGSAKESVKKCDTKLAAPACSKITLTLPKQVCIESAPIYGYGHH